MVRKFEIDIARGIFKAEGEEDFKRMFETLDAIERLGMRPNSQPHLTPHPAPVQEQPQTGLKVLAVLDKLFLLKKNLSPATIMSYRNTINDFAHFTMNPPIAKIGKGDVSVYQEKLARDGNSVRTIDNKVATIRALFSFAIKQGYYFNENPAQGRNLQSKRDKIKNGYAFFTEDEIKSLFQSELFLNEKKRDPDYYYAVLLAYFTGCRIGEITGLKIQQIKKTTEYWSFHITESKTLAGIREVPICINILKKLEFDKFTDTKTDQIFKYQTREGRGSGNAVGKKFTRHLEELKISRPKLVFHSLRKFANDFFASQRVPLEVRCQYFGHEVDNVNINIYKQKLATAELFSQIYHRQTLMHKLIEST